jgi:hypothetical protein
VSRENRLARIQGIMPRLTRAWTGCVAFVMLCAPIFLAGHGAFAEDSCAGGPADHALVEVCPVCELCDSIPSAVDLMDPLEGIASSASPRVAGVPVWSLRSSLDSDPGSPRAPPFLV